MADIQIINGYQGEIAAINQPEKKFNEGNLFETIIKNELNPEKNYVIKKIGIQAIPGTEVQLNSIPIIIGKTGIYEADDVEINSIILNEDNDNIIIDYIVKEV